MRVLAFGTYDRAYPRNAQVISALRDAGVDVVEQRRAVWGGRSDWSLGVAQLGRVARAQLALALAPRIEADVVLVGYPGHLDLAVARRLAHGRPVVFNPLVSLFDTLVTDRRRFRRGSVAAGVVKRVDRWAFGAADLVVADTAEHALFFEAELGVPRDRLAVCFVGAEDRLFRPGPAPERPFHVLFVGKLIPLHGVEVILDAARLLPDVPFRVVGSGQLERLLDARPANVDWVRWVDYERLPHEYREAGCVLGVFGRGAKAARVIPNKAFQAIACGRPLVTADTPAARELLADGRDAVLVPPANAAALAGAIRRLQRDRALADRLGAAGRATYLARASERVLGAQWRALLDAVISRS